MDNYIGTSISSGEGTENMDNYCYNVVVSNRTITCYCESTLCVVGKKKWNKKTNVSHLHCMYCKGTHQGEVMFSSEKNQANSLSHY